MCKKRGNNPGKVPEQMLQSEYNKQFGIDPFDEIILKCALEKAIEIRNFEIDLYWKRANYFWILIASAFAGFFAMSSAK